jgi:hypothetical protein
LPQTIQDSIPEEEPLYEEGILNKDLEPISTKRPPEVKTVVVKRREVINGGGFFET